MAKTLKEQYNEQLRRVNRRIASLEHRGYIIPEDLKPSRVAKPKASDVEDLKRITPSRIYSKSKYMAPNQTIVSGDEGRAIERQIAANKAARTKSLSENEIISSRVKISSGTDSETYGSAEGKRGYNGIQTIADEPKEKKERHSKGRPKGAKDKKPRKKRENKAPVENNIPVATDIVLQNVEEMIAQWTPLSSWTAFFAGVKERDKNILERMLEGAINQEGRDSVAERLEKSSVAIADLVQQILYDSDRNQVQIDLQQFSAIIMGRPLTQDESEEVTLAQETVDSEE